MDEDRVFKELLLLRDANGSVFGNCCGGALEVCEFTWLENMCARFELWVEGPANSQH